MPRSFLRILFTIVLLTTSNMSDAFAQAAPSRSDKVNTQLERLLSPHAVVVDRAILQSGQGSQEIRLRLPGTLAVAQPSGTPALAQPAGTQASSPTHVADQYFRPRHCLLRSYRRPPRRHHRHQRFRPRHHHPHRHRPENQARRIWPARATFFRCARAMVACSFAPARRKRASTSRASPALIRARHLRNHERRRHHVSRAAAPRILQAAQSKDAHGRRPDPLPNAARALRPPRRRSGAAHALRRFPHDRLLQRCRSRPARRAGSRQPRRPRPGSRPRPLQLPHRRCLRFGHL